MGDIIPQEGAARLSFEECGCTVVDVDDHWPSERLLIFDVVPDQLDKVLLPTIFVLDIAGRGDLAIGFLKAHNDNCTGPEDQAVCEFISKAEAYSRAS